MKVADALPRGWTALLDPDSRRIGLGLDLGTTTKRKSNPTALAVVQESPPFLYARLVACWKTSDPNVTRAMVAHVVDLLPAATRLCIDATSERFFAADLRDHLQAKLPVDLVVGSEATDYMGGRMIYKVYLGNLFINTIDDGYLALPAEKWIQMDMRLVVRDRGTFDAEVDEEGRHGDTFDAVKLSLHALIAKGGPVEASATRVGAGVGEASPPRRWEKRPDHSGDIRSGQDVRIR